MIKLLYTMAVVSTLSLFAGESSEAPPAYIPNGFLQALDSENADVMLRQAEIFFDVDYLQAWALATAATAYENGQASYFLAQRLIPNMPNSINRPETYKTAKVGEHYLEQSCWQNYEPALAFYNEFKYEPFTRRYSPADNTLPAFEKLIRTRKKLSAEDFLKHADGFDALDAHYHASKHTMRALAMAMIGFHQYPDNHHLPLWLAYFISKMPRTYTSRSGYNLDCQHVFTQNIPLAQKLIDLANSKIDSVPASTLLLQAKLAKAATDTQKEMAYYRQALRAADFETLPNHQEIKEDIERYLADNCACCTIL